MALTATVRSLASDARELAPEVWRDLEGADAATREMHRRVLLAHLDVIANECLIATATTEGGDIAGLAVGFVEVHPPDRRTLGTALPGMISRGIWSSAGADPVTVTESLLRALCGAAAAGGISSVIVPCLDEHDEHARAIGATVLALGGREVPSPPDYVLDLGAPSTVSSYLEHLPIRHRKDFRRDLRRITKAGAVIEGDHGSDPAALRRAWPFFADTLRRYSKLEIPEGRSLLDALVLRCGAALRLDLMRIGDEDQGALSWLRVGEAAFALHIGHLDRKEVAPYFSLVASGLCTELERGTQRFHLGPAFGPYKERIGCVPRPQKRFVIAQRTLTALA